MERDLTRPRGVSLVELVVTLFVIGIMLILLLNLFPTSMATVKQGERYLQAETLAQSILEQQRARPYKELEVGIYLLDPVRYEGSDLTPTLEVFVIDDVPPEDLLGLRVTVTWQVRKIKRQIQQEVWVADVRQ
jgi:type II secretory pathway pseudopilin PulG